MTDRPRVGDFMTAELVTLRPEMEINQAAALLLEKGYSGAPVTDARGGLVGILSSKDCLKAALQASYFREWSGSVGDYMSRNVQTLDAGLDIVEAANAFVDSSFRRFPVVREGGLVGQVSRSDILRALFRQWS